MPCPVLNTVSLRGRSEVSDVEGPQGSWSQGCFFENGCAWGDLPMFYTRRTMSEANDGAATGREVQFAVAKMWVGSNPALELISLEGLG